MRCYGIDLGTSIVSFNQWENSVWRIWTNESAPLWAQEPETLPHPQEQPGQVLQHPPLLRPGNLRDHQAPGRGPYIVGREKAVEGNVIPWETFTEIDYFCDFHNFCWEISTQGHQLWRLAELSLKCLFLFVVRWCCYPGVGPRPSQTITMTSTASPWLGWRLSLPSMEHSKSGNWIKSYSPRRGDWS